MRSSALRSIPPSAMIAMLSLSDNVELKYMCCDWRSLIALLCLEGMVVKKVRRA